jgi:hypothetical protein
LLAIQIEFRGLKLRQELVCLRPGLGDISGAFPVHLCEHSANKLKERSLTKIIEVVVIIHRHSRTMACLARPSFKLSLRAVIRPGGRQIHSTPVVFKKKKSKAVADDLGDEEWGDVEDLIPVAPISATSTPTPSNPTPTRTAPPAAVVASTSASASTTKPSISRHAKDIRKRLPEAERIKRFQALVDFVTPRVGRHPTLTTPLVRRTAFPVLMQLATNAKHMQTITTLMASWKEGRLGTQGKARFGPDGQPKGAEPFIEATSELFARTPLLILLCSY